MADEQLTPEQLEAEAKQFLDDLLADDLGVEPERYQAEDGDGIDDGEPEEREAAAMLAAAMGGAAHGPWLLVPTEDGRQQRVRVIVLARGGSIVAPPDEVRAVVVVDDSRRKLYFRAVSPVADSSVGLDAFELADATEAAGPGDLKRLIQEMGDDAE